MRYPVWSWLGSERPVFFLGTTLLLGLMLLLYVGGIRASLSLGPGGDFPRFRDVFLYGFSHDDVPSLVVSVALLLFFGPWQERCWGTVAFLALSTLTMTILPLVYTLVLFVFSFEASLVCGYAAIQLALFTAQCRHMTRRRLQRWLPVWILPWLLLLLCLIILPGTPPLLNFCAICIGHNYSQTFIGMLQELVEANVLSFIPAAAYILTTSRPTLPTYRTQQMSRSHSAVVYDDQTTSPSMRDPFILNHHQWEEPQELISPSEAEVLEEQMLRAGIIASLQDAPEHVNVKVEMTKSSVSALRLQQLEKMGFPTEKAVVALAASKQLDGAISLLIDDRVGEQAVVVTKGRTAAPPKHH
ncbi:rhomboid domain-containing protein 3 [Nerophis ophidion]|uniref:rhomboid domain-containing protein 3 n=1 Tax=Nerophis ophidion TaxID=159077 RepID=UPI002ADF6888|nr:rhomboid domain-containing protein 3 [Nerophis ophidion]